VTPERFKELEQDCSLKLTNEEINEGWHFCFDWDGMLIHKSYPEFEVCTCFSSPQPTVPSPTNESP
jgi:hypothetical protein